jgi:hypothetical protein
MRTIQDDVALALMARGIPAQSHHTGGGIICVMVPEPRDAGCEWCFGTADFTWGADLRDCETGEAFEDQILTTSISSDSADAAAIADAIVVAINGAVFPARRS